MEKHVKRLSFHHFCFKIKPINYGLIIHSFCDNNPQSYDNIGVESFMGKAVLNDNNTSLVALVVCQFLFIPNNMNIHIHKLWICSTVLPFQFFSF